MTQRISTIHMFVTLMAYISVKNETGWSWYWVWLAIFGLATFGHVADALLDRYWK